MKLTQIEYVLAVASTGSFSKAASELYVSQPNISSSILALEKELGYDIFNRTNQGISLTVEGNLFLKYATNIIRELKKINIIAEKSPYRNFSAETMFNHTVISQAFSKLCSHYEDANHLNFSIHSNTSNEILEDIYLGKADVGIILINKITLDTYKNTLPKKALAFEVIENMNLNINIRKGHPLLKNNTLDFKHLHKYPHVSYNYNLISDFPDVFSIGLINPDRMINVNDSNTRGQIIISSNAFGIGCDPHPMTRIHDYIVSVPIPDMETYLVIISQEKQSQNEELLLFKELLKTELAKLRPNLI